MGRNKHHYTSFNTDRELECKEKNLIKKIWYKTYNLIAKFGRHGNQMICPHECRGKGECKKVGHLNIGMCVCTYGYMGESCETYYLGDDANVADLIDILKEYRVPGLVDIKFLIEDQMNIMINNKNEIIKEIKNTMDAIEKKKKKKKKKGGKKKKKKKKKKK